MKKLILIIAIAVSGILASAQSIDEHIGAAMNSSDYFGLYDINSGAPNSPKILT